MADKGGIFEKLSRPPEHARHEHLRAWVQSIEGAIPIDQVEARRRCKVAGVIKTIRIDPRQGSGSIEAALIDGSGHILARWLGRPRMAGIRLGMGLILEGTVCLDADGEKMILNPEYQLVANPEHA
ncbi:MAG: OB-fold nucleic acid binding domain-containing protein [Actinobacteria bacterium]|nr:OB-fold nucleic acid binding domain-containing protein [Actinomycetota bacterium]